MTGTSSQYRRGGWCVAAFGILLCVACKDSGPDSSARFVLETAVVSNPTPGPVSGAAATLTLSGAAATEVAYVSVPPGALPSAEQVTITHPRTGARVSVRLVDGGFDPVAIPADAGDTLDVSVRTAGGSIESFIIVVPARRPPIVIRTDPPPRKRDVPLNTTMLVVFSEPINSMTLGDSSVRLTLNGVPLAGALAAADPAHLTARFTPDAALAPGAEYVLEVTQAIEDLDGEALAAPVAVPFTAAAIAQLLVAWDRVSTPMHPGASRLVFHDNRRFSLQAQWPVIGFVQYPGSYQAGPGGLSLTFDDEPCCAGQTWTAFAASRGDSLAVTHAFAPSYPYIEDGVYVRSADTVFAGDAGGRIAFVSDRASPPGNANTAIYLVNPGGSGLLRLTDGAQPAWSWDGQQIAYVASSAAPVIYSTDVDGEFQVVLGEGQSPSWSSDSRIVFTMSDTAILVMDADGSDRTPIIGLGTPGLPPATTKIWRPVWSPDARTIAFDVRTSDPNIVQVAEQIYLVDADGTNLRPLSQDGWSKFSPVWSPDGSRIFVQSWDFCTGCTSTFDPVIVSYAVTTGARVIHYRVQGQWLGGVVGDVQSVSPDGRYLVFTQAGGFGWRGSSLLILDIQSGIVRPLLSEAVNATTADYADRQPKWSRN